MKDVTEFLEECRVNPNEKIDTNDDSFWKLKGLLEHYKEQCSIADVSNRRGLLLNFLDWYNEDAEKTPITEDEIDLFIKEKIK